MRIGLFIPTAGSQESSSGKQPAQPTLREIRALEMKLHEMIAANAPEYRIARVERQLEKLQLQRTGSLPNQSVDTFERTSGKLEADLLRKIGADRWHPSGWTRETLQQKGPIALYDQAAFHRGTLKHSKELETLRQDRWSESLRNTSGRPPWILSTPGEMWHALI